MLNRQFTHTGANTERLDTIGPEILVTKEGFDDSRDSSYMTKECY
jgi:hypothetical protein